MMNQMTLDDYMALRWETVVEQIPDGWRLRVRGLQDLEVFGDSRELVEREWRDALRSHLGGYLSVGKIVPAPAATPPTSSGSPVQIVTPFNDQSRPMELFA